MSGEDTPHAPTSAPDVVQVNGVPADQVSTSDRGLHFGDGLFETIACLHGRPRFLTLHLERLAQGCARLGITFDASCLRNEVEALAQPVDRALVKVIVTRGPAVARGYGVTGAEKATRITFRYGWPPENRSWGQDGVRVRVASLRLGENPALAGLKHCNRLEQVLARSEWNDPEVLEALLFSSSGRLVSGTMTNVFLVQGSRLRTPRVDRCGVAGVMRRVVLREAARVGIAAQECELTAEDLHIAEEVFLTNARVGIWPVRSLDSRALTPGPVTRRLQEALAPLLEAPADV
jgi:4-amino-4-deoxychorismate lyase